jgi:hypothetical protein
MNELSQLNLLNETEFMVWKNSLNKPLVCPEFHEKVLHGTPTCSFCKLKPKDHPSIGDASQYLDRLEETLADMLLRWRQALRTNLTSDAAQASLVAMAPKERQPVEDFLQQADNTPTLPKDFVEAANQALQGIHAITLPVDELIETLKAGGLPSTLNEIQRRFNDFLQQKMKGHDPRNTRLTLDK